MFSQAQKKIEKMKSKSSKLVVAAFDFGAINLGCAFSWISEWSKVVVNSPENHEFMMLSKAPTTLLLYPDQSLCAFGYEAEDIYSKMTVNDSESDDKKDKFKKKANSGYYYFKKLTLCLHEKNVSKSNIILQRYPCGYTSLDCRPFKSVDVNMYHFFNRNA